jgi:hypothetical protein
MLRFFVLHLLAVLAGLQAEPSLPHPKGYVCLRAESPIRIDGRIDQQWAHAPWTDFFLDIEGPTRPAPRFRTRARMLWDDRFFYIAADLREPHIWATLTEHDSVIFHDNDFEVFIDPNSDSHEYFEFEINALNTGWDLFLPKPYKDGGKADNGWEIPGLQTAVAIDGTLNNWRDTDRAWTVEIAIPWSAFKRSTGTQLPPSAGDQWRVNFSRVEWQHEIADGKYRRVPGTKEDNWVWSPQFQINMHLPEMWGYVQFDRSTRTPSPLRADPCWDVRMQLQRYYSLQHQFQKQNQRWATPAEAPLEPGMRFEQTADGWKAGARCQGQQLWIAQDARVWRE